MAIKTTINDEKIIFELTRGHYAQLIDATKRMNFKDVESCFLYTLSVLVTSSVPRFTIIDKKYEKQTFVPAEYLLKDDEVKDEHN